MRPDLLRVWFPLLTILLSFLVAPVALADEEEGEVPEFLTLLPHRGDVTVDPGWRFDWTLESRLKTALSGLGLDDLVRQRKMGVALVDLSAGDGTAPRLAEVNGAEMMYAASVPKIAALYAAYQAQADGALTIDPAICKELNDMCRYSSNQAASAVIHRVGFNYIASALWQSGLYDPELGGGLWIGKAYAGPEYWHRDPIANLSHGATPLALAKLLVALEQERLVSPEASRQMKLALGEPGLHHKFVRGLDARPGSRIYRKSGTWSRWHGDAAIVERGDKRYVAVALIEDERGQQLLERIILALDDCIAAPAATPPAPSVAQASAAAIATAAAQ